MQKCLYFYLKEKVFLKSLCKFIASIYIGVFRHNEYQNISMMVLYLKKKNVYGQALWCLKPQPATYLCVLSADPE